MKLTCDKQWVGMKVHAVAFRLMSQMKHFWGQLPEERAWERTELLSAYRTEGGGSKGYSSFSNPIRFSSVRPGPADPSDFKRRYYSLFLL